MSKRSMIAASVLAVAGISGSAMANGLIRSPGLSPDHSAFSIGQGPFGMSSYTLGNANPSLATAPFNSATGGDAALYTDVVSPYTATGNYQSDVDAANSATSQASAYKWFMFANTSAGGTRDVVGAGTFGSVTSQTYSGNTSVITYNNFGTGNWRVNLVITTSVNEGASPGQVIVVSNATATRIGGLFNDASSYNISLGSLVDLDVGSNGSASDTVTNVSGTGEVRFLYTDSSGYTGQTLGIGSPTYLVGTRSTVGSTSNLDGAGLTLGNTIGAAGDNTTGYLWQGTLPTVGSRFSATMAFSIGTAAAVPEPTTLAAIGGAGLLALRRRGR